MIEGGLVELISICICTRNRVDDLKSAIQSIYQSTYKNFEIIISDDSTNDESEKMVIKEFPKVKYMQGPQKGLCFNRNNALKLVSGSRVMFMDDDVIMSYDFLEKIINGLMKIEPAKRNRAIMTGIEINNGSEVYPNKIDFLGFQTKAYKKKEPLNTIVINSTIFPLQMFKKIQFDQQLVYGYDEVDIAARALALNYKIYLCKEAINNHYPSAINRDYYLPYKEASRIYVTFKKYYKLERSIAKALFYLGFCYVHMLGYQVKKNNIKAFSSTSNIMKRAIEYIRNLESEIAFYKEKEKENEI